MKLAISLDSQSKIDLTGDSCYTELKNPDLTGSNLINGTYTWTKYEERQPENQGSEANRISNSKLIYLILGMILISLIRLYKKFEFLYLNIIKMKK